MSRCIKRGRQAAENILINDLKSAVALIGELRDRRTFQIKPLLHAMYKERESLWKNHRPLLERILLRPRPGEQHRARPFYTPTYFMLPQKFKLWCKIVRLWEQAFHPAVGVSVYMAQAYKKPPKRRRAKRNLLRDEFKKLRPDVGTATQVFRTKLNKSGNLEVAIKCMLGAIRSRHLSIPRKLQEPLADILKSDMELRRSPARITAKLVAQKHSDPGLASRLLSGNL